MTTLMKRSCSPDLELSSDHSRAVRPRGRDPSVPSRKFAGMLRLRNFRDRTLGLGVQPLAEQYHPALSVLQHVGSRLPEVELSEAPFVGEAHDDHVRVPVVRLAH